MSKRKIAQDNFQPLGGGSQTIKRKKKTVAHSFSAGITPCTRKTDDILQEAEPTDSTPSPLASAFPLVLHSKTSTSWVKKLVKARKIGSLDIDGRLTCRRIVTYGDYQNQNVLGQAMPAPLTLGKQELITARKGKRKPVARKPEEPHISWSGSLTEPQTMQLKSMRALHKWIAGATRIQIGIHPNQFTIFRLYKQQGKIEQLIATIVAQ